jgi:hypothetical protein
VRALASLRQLPGILVPLVLIVAVMAVALRLVNGVPSYAQSLIAGPPPPQNVLDERLTYPSVEAAQKDLGVTIALPAYFPSYLTWPATSIHGQREPARVVSMLFRSSNGQQGLQIRELFWQGVELPFPVPEPVEVVERSNVDVNGVAGQLLVGSGQGNTAVNQLRWHAGGIHFILTTIYPPDELLKIARSMRY